MDTNNDDEQPAANLSEAEQLFMARLSSQFGDLDLKNLLDEEEEEKEDERKNMNEGGMEEEFPSEESSLNDPSPEELAAWQAQQFAKGKAVVEAKQQEEMDPIQKRRLQLRKEVADALQLQTKKSSSSSESDGAGCDGGWEQVAASPNLQGQSSIFFPSSMNDDNGMGGGTDDYDDTDSSSVVVLGSHPLLQQLATLGDAEILGTAWHRLYSSVDGDGLSFHNLLYSINGYDGPTVILLKCLPSKSRSLPRQQDQKQSKASPATIGFFTTTTWQESTDYFGSNTDDCFLFSLNYDTNHVKVFRPRSWGMTQRKGGTSTATLSNKQKHDYMYCHPSTLSSRRGGGKTKGTTDGAVHGIGIGGKPSQPRLHLTETLEECRALTYDLSFEDGDLLGSSSSTSDGNNPFHDSLYYFDVDCLEAWGVGGNAWIQDALAARNKARGISASSLKKRQVIDKSQVLDDFRNGLLSMTTKTTMGSGTYFSHLTHTTDERCDT